MKTFCIMVVEDDLVTSITLCKALCLGVPDASVLAARSLAEARLLLEEYVVNFFVLDIHLPDGSGIDFIFDVTIKNPEATIVLITATPLPEYRDQAEAFGVMHFMAKPIDHPTLLGVVKASRKPAPRKPQEDTTLFNASLSRLTVLDIIQLKCLNNSTQALHFSSSKYGAGRVYFQNGDIVHAETARNKGMAALSEIIGWKGGRAVETADTWAADRTISGGWQNALLVAAHAVDEKAEAVSPRQPPQSESDLEIPAEHPPEAQ